MASSESAPRSKHARASLVLSAASWAAWLLYALASAAVMGAANLELSFDADAAGYSLGLAAMIVFPLALLLASAGLVLGIRALVKGDPPRRTAILGLVMSMLCLLPSVLLILYVASISGGVGPRR